MHDFDKLETSAPQIDLKTVRETLVYIRDDLSQVGELRHVAIAMQEAISQIEVAEARSRLPGLQFFRRPKHLSGPY